MVFDPKKAGERFAHQMVLDGGFLPETIANTERDTLQTFSELAQSTPQVREEFEKAALQELTQTDWKRHLGLNGGMAQGAFFQDRYYFIPNFNHPENRKELILKMLDHRLAKPLPIGEFRGPELERIRSLYLTGKEIEPSTSRYVWDAKIPDFRNGAARGTPFLLIPLLLKAPILGILLAGVGIDYGVKAIEASRIKLEKAQSQRDRNEAIREEERGKTSIYLSVISLLIGGLRIFKASPKALPLQETEAPIAKVLPLDQAERTIPLPTAPLNSGEEIADLTAIRAARIASKVEAPNRSIPTQNFQAANDNAYPVGTSPQPLKPSLALDRTIGQTTPSTSPILTSQGSASSAQATVAMSAAEGSAVQMEQGTLVCIGNTVRAIAPKPIHVLPVPASMPGQVGNGVTQTSSTPIALVDYNGDPVSHVSILNSLIEGAATVVSALAMVMSTQEPPGKSDDPSQVEDPDADKPDETTALVVREKGDLVRTVGTKVKELAKIGIRNIGNPIFFIIELHLYFLLYPLKLIADSVIATSMQLFQVMEQRVKVAIRGGTLLPLTRLDFLSQTLLLGAASFNKEGVSEKARDYLARVKMSEWNPEHPEEIIHFLERYNQRFPFFYQYLQQTIYIISKFFEDCDWPTRWKLLVELFQQFEPEMIENVRGIYRPMARNEGLLDYSAHIAITLVKIYQGIKGIPSRKKIDLFFYLLKHKNDFPIFIMAKFIKKDLIKILPIFEKSIGTAEQIGTMLLLILRYRYEGKIDRLEQMKRQIEEGNRQGIPLNMQIDAFRQRFGGETFRPR